MSVEPPKPGESDRYFNNPIFLVLVLSLCFLFITFLHSEFWQIYLVVYAASLWAIFRLSASGDAQKKVHAAKYISEFEPNTERNSLADALQHPVIIVDSSGVIKFANEASRNVFGEAREGEQIFIRFRNPELRKAIERVFANAEAERMEYCQRVPADRWFNVEIAPFPGKRSGLFAISFHDFTEAKRIDQMRSDFIANASHELRTPLSSLIGYLQTMKGPAKNDPKASEKFVDIMLDQSERMARLVNDLLSLSGIEMKAHVKPTGTADLLEIVKAVVSSLDKLTRQMGVEIVLNSQADRYLVNGDRDELMQVFENLIENGCKYGEEGGRVEIDLSIENPDENPYAVIIVRDFGPGIPMEHQHRITERFYRVDVARSREKQGTGLGLAIVKHILQRHGTRLQLKSNPGEGSEFFVKLPIVVDVQKAKKE